MPLAEAAATLAGCLLDTAPLWRPVPFHDDPRWVHDHPALIDTLLALPDSEIDRLDEDAETLVALLSPYVPAVRSAHHAASACLDPAPIPGPIPDREANARDIPGRKWGQLRYFASACGTPAGPMLEWCGGKAHLGRLFARVHGCRVTALDRNVALCADGERLAAREHAPVRVLARDVLTIEPDDPLLRNARHAIALHACGDLHLALLHTGCAAGLPALDIAPCCYHLSRETNWQPLSALLAAHPLASLGLTRDDLRLAVQETRTASARVVNAQRTLAAWRLGFDRLQRERRGIDRYLPTPPRPARLIAEGFAAFCHSLAEHHGISLPRETDFSRYANEGERRASRVRRLELLRHAFRRPLEVLLVADRGLYLAERGYEVRLRAFCPPELTPRNLLLQGRRKAGPEGPAGAGQRLPPALPA